jgi:hypothetical protein
MYSINALYQERDNMSSTIKTYIELKIDNKNFVILSKNYSGSPIFYYNYDVLIGPKNTIEKYKHELFPQSTLKNNWYPIVRYSD